MLAQMLTEVKGVEKKHYYKTHGQFKIWKYRQPGRSTKTQLSCLAGIVLPWRPVGWDFISGGLLSDDFLQELVFDLLRNHCWFIAVASDSRCPK